MSLPFNRRQFTLAAASAWLGAGTPVQTMAQSTLPKTISLVVPNAAGGSNDVMARAVAMRLPSVLGISVVVDNRAGAGGNVGSAYVAKSAPRDGSTWLVTINSTQTINPSLYKSTGFDPLADFEPVAGIAVVQHVFLVPKTLPVNNLAELIELARRESGKLSYGSAGNGTFSHLLMEMLKMSQGLQITHVPYKGVAPALTDLVAGNVQVLISTIPACLQFIKSGQVKALAVPSLQRAPALPQVPLANEVVPGLVGELWVAMYAPQGVPRDMIEQMRQGVAKVQALPDMDAFFQAQGASAMKAGPAELLAATKEEFARWAPIIKASGMRVD